MSETISYLEKTALWEYQAPEHNFSSTDAVRGDFMDRLPILQTPRRSVFWQKPTGAVTPRLPKARSGGERVHLASVVPVIIIAISADDRT